MPKSTALNFTQNINTVYAEFFSSDTLRVVAVSTNGNGVGLQDGTRTFTAATGTGTVQSGGALASWTATAIGGRVIGSPTIVNGGDYLTPPQLVVANPATVVQDNPQPTTAATWNLRVENYKELYTASSNDAVVKAINVSSFDAIRVMALWIVNTDNQPVLLGATSIPANSGNLGAVAAVDLLSGLWLPSLPYDANGKRIIPLKAGQKLALSVPQLTLGAQINAVAMVEEY
jgi:hypothetical protein